MPKKQTQKAKPDYAVVIALYNEEGNVIPLVDRLNAVFKDIKGNVQFWFVDDGSTDGTAKKIKERAAKQNNINLISLSRNFGHHAALFAGLDFAQADYFILMDGDLQDQPEDIPRLIAEQQRGYDLVYAIRSNRIENVTRRQVSGLFWHLVNFLSDHHAPPNQAVMRLFTKDVRDAVTRSRERHLFLAGIFAWVGFKQTTIEIEHKPRNSGQTKYTARKLLGQVLNAVTSFSVKPLRYINYAGFFIAAVAFLIGMGLIILRVVADQVFSGWTSIMVAIFFALGIQMIAIGMIGEYVGRIFQQGQRRPNYIVREILEGRS